MADKFIRSYDDYAHRFILSTGEVLVPSRHSKPSTVKVTEEQLAELRQGDEFKALESAKSHQFRVLDAMPRDQLDTMDRIAEANDKAAEAVKEAEAAKAEAQKAKDEFEAFKASVVVESGADVESLLVKKAEEEKAEALAALESIKAEFERFRAGLKSDTVEVVKTEIVPEVVVTTTELPETPVTVTAEPATEPVTVLNTDTQAT